MFLVQKGRTIVIDPLPEVEERVLRLFVLGPVLAVLLHQRGRLVLHASAVAIAGGAIAFLGDQGWGKSTMVAALYARGHRVVADDVTAIQVDPDEPLVFPGFPQLKLWPQVVGLLGEEPESLPRLGPHIEKRASRVDYRFFSSPLPLRRIYVLAEAETMRVERLDPQEALVELIRHTYGARSLKNVRTSSRFLQCVDLVRNVSMYRLSRPKSLAALPEVTRLVESDSLQD